MAEILLQHLLVRTAAKHPEMTAVVDGGKEITYDKLNRISNQVARQLMECGCKTGATVAVYLPKSIETVVAFFGVLKAGGAYVPLDAHYSPPKRM